MMGKKVIIDLYARVSTEDQNVKQQMEHLKEWAKKNNYTVLNVVMDTESGTKPLIERKRFLGLLDRSRPSSSNAMGIVNLDRLTRNWEDVVFIEKHFRVNWERYKLLSMGDDIDLSNASGRLMFRMKMAICCYMPEDMREKQKIGIDRAKKQGKYKGGKPGRHWKDG